MNFVAISGRLTADPEVRYSQGTEPKAVASFIVAADRPKRSDGADAGADFIRVKVFGKQAESCETYIGKGCRVEITGKWQTGSYDDKDGNKVYTNDLVANRVEFIDFKNEKSEKASDKNEDTTPEGFEELDDDVPF